MPWPPMQGPFIYTGWPSTELHSTQPSINQVDNNIEQLKHVARENAKSWTEPVPAIFDDIVVHVAQHNDRDAMTTVLPTFST